MDRFFVDPLQVTGDIVTFSPDQARQMARVLRLRPGQQVYALDDQGSYYLVELRRVAHMAAHGIILERLAADTEPRVRVTLWQALMRGAKWEYVLQKGTEVGIAAFAPVVTERCVALYEPERWDARQERWAAVLREAAEQSGRSRIPALRAPVSWEEACHTGEGLRLLLHPSVQSVPLEAALAAHGDATTVSLYVGPEGGFTEAEVAQAEQLGITSVRLGPRILRTETAGMVAAAALFYALGDLS